MAKTRRVYTVVTPWSGVPFRTSVMVLNEVVEDESGSMPRVFVALSPIIEAWITEDFDESSEGVDVQLCSRANVYAFDP